LIIGIGVAVSPFNEGLIPGRYKDKENTMENEKQINETCDTCSEEPQILEEIQIEELAIDGICGVY
jgi:mycofactocin precursor